jgi:hypothetical protein
MASITTRPRVLRLRSEHLDDWVLISVEDTGSGINPEHAERMFDPFFTTKPNGIGLGLFICRSIVEAHEGRLSVFPVHPHGSVFQVMLPAAINTQQAAACSLDPKLRTSMKDLYDSYYSWCDSSSLEPLHSTLFGKELTRLGYKIFKANKGNGRIGIGLKQPPAMMGDDALKLSMPLSVRLSAASAVNQPLN